MLAWSWKKLEQLLDTVVDPLWKRVLGLPWVGRLAILVCCAVALAAGAYWKEAQHFLATGARIVTVTLRSSHDGIPLSSDYRRRVKEGATRLATSLEADLSSRDNPFVQELGPWAPAQMVIALKDISFWLKLCFRVLFDQ
jgi:hypothetical protein